MFTTRERQALEAPDPESPPSPAATADVVLAYCAFRVHQDLATLTRVPAEPVTAEQALATLTDGVLRHITRSVDDLTAAAVHRARTYGATWDQIAAAFGITRQSAQTKWPDVPIDVQVIDRNPGHLRGIVNTLDLYHKRGPVPSYAGERLHGSSAQERIKAIRARRLPLARAAGVIAPDPELVEQVAQLYEAEAEVYEAAAERLRSTGDQAPGLTFKAQAARRMALQRRQAAFPYGRGGSIGDAALAAFTRSPSALPTDDKRSFRCQHCHELFEAPLTIPVEQEKLAAETHAAACAGSPDRADR